MLCSASTHTGSRPWAAANHEHITHDSTSTCPCAPCPCCACTHVMLPMSMPMPMPMPMSMCMYAGRIEIHRSSYGQCVPFLGTSVHALLGWQRRERVAGKAHNLGHSPAGVKVPLCIGRIGRPAHRLARKRRRGRFVDGHEVADEAAVVVGERGIVEQALLARGPKVQAHPDTAILEVETRAPDARGALRRVPRGNVCAQPVPCRLELKVVRLKRVKLAFGSFRAPPAVPLKHLGNPCGEALPMWFIVRSYELVKVRVGKRLAIEARGKAVQRGQTAYLLHHCHRLGVCHVRRLCGCICHLQSADVEACKRQALALAPLLLTCG